MPNIIPAVFIFASAVLLPKTSQAEYSYIQNLGAVFNSSYVVKNIQPQSLFHQGDFQVGDKILEINGAAPSSCEDILNVYMLSGDRKFSVKFERNGKTRSTVLKPRIVVSDTNGDFIEKVENLVICGNQVNLMIVAKPIKWLVPLENVLSKKYSEAEKARIVNDMEKMFLPVLDHMENSMSGTYAEIFSWAPNFKLISRKQTEDILKEIKFQNTGAVDEASRAMIGKLSGATHLFSIEMMLDNSNAHQVRAIYKKYELIDIESGETLSLVDEVVKMDGGK